MKNQTMLRTLLFAVTLGTSTASVRAQDPVRVVTTLPVYASIAQSVGGDHVNASWIAEPNEDSHFVRPKPSFALELRRADMFVTTGLDLELWVPALLDKAGNGNVLEGGRGYVTAYTGIELLDIPAAADRSQGDVHVFGNPHLHTDPLRAIQVAANITTGLKRVAPERSDAFEEGLQRFRQNVYRRLFGADLVEVLGGETLDGLARNGRLFQFLEDNELEGESLTALLGGWFAQAESLRGAEVICYHKNWAYLEDRFGLTCAEYVETKPGIPPTPRHAGRLISLMRDEDLRVLLAASYFDRGRIENVAARGDAQPVIVPMQTHARAGLEEYPALMDLWITTLVSAVTDSR